MNTNTNTRATVNDACTNTNTRATVNDACTNTTRATVNDACTNTSKYHLTATPDGIRETEYDCRLYLSRLTDQQLEDALQLLYYCFTLSDQSRREGVEAFFRLSVKEYDAQREGGGQA